MIGKVLYSLYEAFSHAASPLKTKGRAPGPLHSIYDFVLIVPEVWSYPGNVVGIDPKEKEAQGTLHLGRRGAWNEDRKEAMGPCCLFLAVYRRIRQEAEQCDGEKGSSKHQTACS